LEVSNAKQARSAQSLDDNNLKRNLAVEYKLSDIELKELEESGRHDEAYHFCQKQYNKLLELVGTENKLTLKARLRFGALLERQGRPTEAMELYKDMLEGCGSSDFAQFTSLQYDTTKRLTRLYESREDKGQLIKDMYIRSWDRTKRLEDALRKESYRRIFRDLFCCLKELNRPEEACAVFEKAWEMRPSRTSWDQKAISSIGLSLAKAYYGLGRQIEAIDLLTTICDHDELAYGCTDKTSLESLNQLSRYFSEQKKYQLALDIHNKVLAAADVAFFGISSVDISPRNLRRAGRGSAAAYRSGRLLAPPGHSVVIEQFNMKGRALQRLGRWDEARSVYDEAFQKCNNYYGPRGWYPRKADNIRAWDGEVGRYLMGVSVRARVSP
jgi:tetratricopeptide (TPR) repeat protein